MRETIRTMLLSLGLAASLGAGAAEVIVHDPVMAYDGKAFYVFSTGPNIPFYRSKDLTHWKKAGEVFSEEPTITRSVAPEYVGFPWAPDISYHDGRYYLYFAVSAFGKNSSGIGVAINKTLNPESPDYHWEQMGTVIQSVVNRDDWNAIDPNLVEDDQGNAWLTFGSFWSGIKLFKLNAERTRPAEPQEWYELAARPRIPHDTEVPPRNGAVEAPFIFKKNGYYYLFVSFDLCCRAEKSTYNLRVGRSKTITGPYLDKAGVDMREGGGSLLLSGNAHYPALGHNGAYTVKGKDYLVFHAYDAMDKYQPKLKVLEMHWDKDLWPTVKVDDLNKNITILN